MKTIEFLTIVLLLTLSAFGQATSKQEKTKTTAAEKELREFYDGYADDLRASRGAAIADRYDARGYYSLGNGSKRLVSFADAREGIQNNGRVPKALLGKIF